MTSNDQTILVFDYTGHYPSYFRGYADSVMSTDATISWRGYRRGRTTSDWHVFCQQVQRHLTNVGTLLPYLRGVLIRITMVTLREERGGPKPGIDSNTPNIRSLCLLKLFSLN